VLCSDKHWQYTREAVPTSSNLLSDVFTHVSNFNYLRYFNTLLDLIVF
jgi:hypothetical protein